MANHLVSHFLRTYRLAIFTTNQSPRHHPASCVVLFRIAKDFGDDVLPFMGSQEYLVTSDRRILSRNRWLEVLLTLRGLVECIDVDGLPGWTTSPNDNGILLLLVE